MEGQRTKAILLSAAVVAVLLSTVSFASAQFSSQVTFPDGSLALNENLGFGINALIVIDYPGDLDIFTYHTNASGQLVGLSLAGFPTGFAYWLNVLGLVGSRLLFDVYTTTGGQFFFVGQFLL